MAIQREFNVSGFLKNIHELCAIKAIIPALKTEIGEYVIIVNKTTNTTEIQN